MPAKDETFTFSRFRPIPQKGSDPLNQTELLFPLIFISLEDDSSIVIPPQPTSPGRDHVRRRGRAGRSRRSC